MLLMQFSVHFKHKKVVKCIFTLKKVKILLFSHLIGISPGAGQGPGIIFKSDKKGRGKQKKVMSPGLPGGGMGQNNLTGA